MKDEIPSLPTKEGLERARTRAKERTKRQPSDNLVRIIDEVTRENDGESNELDIAAKAQRPEGTL